MGTKHRDLETVPGFQRCSAQRVGARISGTLSSLKLWESGSGARVGWEVVAEVLGSSRLSPETFPPLQFFQFTYSLPSPVLLGKGSPWRATTKQEEPLGLLQL